MCAYCEIELNRNNRQIAHFHPKSDISDGQTNWVLIWENLWLACKGGSQSWMKPTEYLPPTVENLSCDEAKKDEVVDGLVLAPGDIPAFPRIFRFEQQPGAIRIAPDEYKCHEAGIPVEIVEETIKKFNLNCRRLTDARLAVHRRLENLIKAMKTKTTPGRLLDSLSERFLSKKPNGCYHSFFTRSYAPVWERLSDAPASRIKVPHFAKPFAATSSIIRTGKAGNGKTLHLTGRRASGYTFPRWSAGTSRNLIFGNRKESLSSRRKFTNKVIRLWEREPVMLLRLKNKNKVFFWKNPGAMKNSPKTCRLFGIFLFGF